MGEAVEAKREEADKQAEATKAQNLAAEAHAKVKDLQNQLKSTALSPTEKAALQKELAEAIANKEVKKKQAKEAVQLAKKAKKEREEKEAQVAAAEEEAHKAVQEHAQTSQAKAMKLQQEAVEAKREEADKQAE